MWVNELWLTGTAILFTVVGIYFGRHNSINQLTEAVIDSLIDQGYLKTSGTGKNVDIIKWRDWCDDQDPN